MPENVGLPVKGLTKAILIILQSSFAQPENKDKKIIKNVCAFRLLHPQI